MMTITELTVGAVILAATLATGFAPPSPSRGITILGTRYSMRLASFVQRVESSNRKSVVFEENTTNEDDNTQCPTPEIIVRIHKAASEDTIAHELMHCELFAEGYPTSFAIQGVWLSATLRMFFAGTPDHLVINRRLVALGYDPVNLGFLSGLKSQYVSVLSLHLPPNAGPDQRSMLKIGVLSELMKHVFYIESPDAEVAILRAFPSVGQYWDEIKREREMYVHDPSPVRAWSFVQQLDVTLDKVSTDEGASFRFSQSVGFSPACCFPEKTHKAASSIFSVLDGSDDFQLIFIGHAMVRVIKAHEKPDLTLSVDRFAIQYHVDLR